METAHRSWDSEECFIGGMRVSLRGRILESWSWADMDCVNASRPLVELTVGASSISVRARWRWLRRLFGRLLPTVELSLDDLQAQPIGKSTLTRGVLLNGRGRDGELRSVIFWCSKPTQERLLAVLKREGVGPGKRGVGT